MIKDSGDRTQFDTGAVRDMAKGKGRMDLLPWIALIRVSKHYEAGAEKYGEHNWEQGLPSSSYLSSAFRHLAKYADGWKDEDHLSAAVFNILGLIYNEGKQRGELMDVPRQGIEDISASNPYEELIRKVETKTCSTCKKAEICLTSDISDIKNGRHCAYYEVKDD